MELDVKKLEFPPFNMKPKNNVKQVYCTKFTHMKIISLATVLKIPEAQLSENILSLFFETHKNDIQDIAIQSFIKPILDENTNPKISYHKNRPVGRANRPKPQTINETKKVYAYLNENKEITIDKAIEKSKISKATYYRTLKFLKRNNKLEESTMK